jgi:hypothetical protein
MAELWSDAADYVLSNLEKPINTKFGLSLKTVLTNPAEYLDEKDVQMKLSNIRETVNTFIGNRLEEMKDQVKALDDSAMKASSVTAQISQGASGLAKQYKIPLMKPSGVDRPQTDDTIIYISSAGPETMQLAEKLVAGADYILDISAKYKEYNIGRWLFSGRRDTILAVNFGPSPALTMYETMVEMDSTIDAASQLIMGIVGK